MKTEISLLYTFLNSWLPTLSLIASNFYSLLKIGLGKDLELLRRRQSKTVNHLTAHFLIANIPLLQLYVWIKEGIKRRENLVWLLRVSVVFHFPLVNNNISRYEWHKSVWKGLNLASVFIF